jgi:hypothetical protein
LSAPKSLIEVSDGRVWAKNAGENEGSSFIFTLPLPIKIIFDPEMVELWFQMY